MSFFRDGQQWLVDTLTTWASTENTLEFEYGDTGDTIDLTGTGVCIGRHPELVDTNDNRAYLDVEQRHWLIPRQLLSRMPQAGDKMRETENGVTYEFEGADYAGTPAGVWSTRQRIWYRFNTVQVKVL